MNSSLVAGKIAFLDVLANHTLSIVHLNTRWQVHTYELDTDFGNESFYGPDLEGTLDLALEAILHG